MLWFIDNSESFTRYQCASSFFICLQMYHTEHFSIWLKKPRKVIIPSAYWPMGRRCRTPLIHNKSQSFLWSKELLFSMMLALAIRYYLLGIRHEKNHQVESFYSKAQPFVSLSCETRVRNSQVFRRPACLEMTQTHHRHGMLQPPIDVCTTFTLWQRRVRLMRRSGRTEAAWELQMAHYYWQQWVLSPARLKVTLADISESAAHPQVSPETDYCDVRYKHGGEWNVNILTLISTSIVQVVIVTTYSP